MTLDGKSHLQHAQTRDRRNCRQLITRDVRRRRGVPRHRDRMPAAAGLTLTASVRFTVGGAIQLPLPDNSPATLEMFAGVSSSYRMHGVDCGLLHKSWSSVVCWVHQWALQKLLNRLRCHLWGQTRVDLRNHVLDAWGAHWHQLPNTIYDLCGGGGAICRYQNHHCSNFRCRKYHDVFENITFFRYFYIFDIFDKIYRKWQLYIKMSFFVALISLEEIFQLCFSSTGWYINLTRNVSGGLAALMFPSLFLNIGCTRLKQTLYMYGQKIKSVTFCKGTLIQFFINYFFYWNTQIVQMNCYL